MKSWIWAVLTIVLGIASNGIAVAAAEPAGNQQQAIGKSEVRKIPRMTVALIRGTRPIEGCGPAWDKLIEWATKNKLLHEETVYAGISYDETSVRPPENAQYDACISVPKGTKGDGEVVICEIAGSDYAVFLHRGPYENLRNIHLAIHGQWKPEAEFKVGSGPYLEIYKTPSKDTPPEKLLTEICVPLEK